MILKAPTLTGPILPDAYGIRYNPASRKWEAVSGGRVVAERNTALDASCALLMSEYDGEVPHELAGMVIKDLIGQAPIETDQISIPTPQVFALMALLSLGAVGMLGLLVWAIVNHLR